MSHELNENDKTLITEEVERYQAVHKHIQKKMSEKIHELQDNQKLARSLTAQIVAEQREEEKQALQSDEHVAHGLAKLRLQQSDSLGNLFEQPYFARVIYQEKNREIEFKLGLASFPEERIIDWRKGPISKLYYQYEEGDEYDDEIAGVERQGVIKLKRGYRGELHELFTIETKNQTYTKNHGQWNKQQKFQNVVFDLKDKEKIKALLQTSNGESFSRLENDNGYLPQILSLMTPEQFRLISLTLDKPLVIQGSAGTGKTTVALHRLAWLLFEDNSPAKEENSLVMMFHQTLAKYVKHVLPGLGIKNVKIATYQEWARDIIQTSITQKINFFNQDVPAQVALFKSRYDIFSLFENFLKNQDLKNTDFALLWKNFYQSAEIKTKLNELSSAWSLQKYFDWQQDKQIFDNNDLAFLLQYIYQKQGYYSSRLFPSILDHLVIDEAQDFTLAELKTLLHALNDINQLCLAGDLGQKIVEHRDFGTWQDVLKEFGFDGTDIINLNVAFRSTHQIYELAEFVRDPLLKEDDLKLIPRFGPEPTLTMCSSESDALLQVKNWIEMVRGLQPQSVAAVICQSSLEARRIYEYLLKASVHGVRLGNWQDFEFSPGVIITDVQQVKGLEFRSVLLFEVSEKNYPQASKRSQNELYVAITRAELRLDFVCYNEPSALLPDFLVRKDLTQDLILHEPSAADETKTDDEDNS